VVEGVRVGLRQQCGIDSNLDLVGALSPHTAHDLVRSFADGKQRRCDANRGSLETRQIKELVDDTMEALTLLVKGS
jgi:hypothetical protein